MGALDEPLGLRVGGPADDHLGGQHAAKRLAFLGQLSPPGAPASDRAFTVPDQRPRHRPQLLNELPPAGEQVLSAPGRDQHGHQPARIGADHGQHRQHAGCAGLAEPDRQLDRREPQIALGDLPGRIGRARSRIRWQIHRPQLGDPRREHPDRAGPADPLGDHRGRHPRIRLQQLPDARLDLINDRTPRWPFIFRRPVRRQRGLDGVLRDAQHPSDHLDRQALGPMQTTNLSPIFHRQHSLLVLLARLEPGHRTRGSKFSCRAGVRIHVPLTGWSTARTDRPGIARAEREVSPRCKSSGSTQR